MYKNNKATTIELSELVMRISTQVICHTIVNCQDLLREERTSVAHAFLQRVMTTHLCNHKLTKEGLVYEYKGQPFELHEEYKTMTLTRTVYEHLAMFYFLFEHPKTDEEREAVWQNWQSDNWREITSFNQAWRYLFKDKEMATFYRQLSMHCHPVHQGLVQYQSQDETDGDNDCIPLYFSCRFLAHLTRLFLKQVPGGSEMLREEFTEKELSTFKGLTLTSASGSATTGYSRYGVSADRRGRGLRRHHPPSCSSGPGR